MAKPVEVTDRNFEETVIKATQPVLVDFWAPWCPPCKAVAPIVEDLAGEYGDRVTFAKVNTDENPQASAKYGVRSIPTLIVFKGGKPDTQVVGLRPKADLKKMLEKALAP